MSKNRIILCLGIFLLIVPILGFPASWKTIFFIVAGLILISLSLSNSMKRRMARPTPPTV